MECPRGGGGDIRTGASCGVSGGRRETNDCALLLGGGGGQRGQRGQFWTEVSSPCRPRRPHQRVGCDSVWVVHGTLFLRVFRIFAIFRKLPLSRFCGVSRLSSMHRRRRAKPRRCWHQSLSGTWITARRVGERECRCRGRLHRPWGERLSKVRPNSLLRRGWTR